MRATSSQVARSDVTIAWAGSGWHAVAACIPLARLPHAAHRRSPSSLLPCAGTLWDVVYTSNGVLIDAPILAELGIQAFVSRQPSACLLASYCAADTHFPCLLSDRWPQA